MKFLAILLLACIISLSALSGMVNTAVPIAEKMCCNKSHKKDACGGDKNNCSKECCTMMLTCGICRFLVVEPLTIKPILAKHIDKLFSPYNTGDIASYHPDNWKPPKA